MSVVSMPYELPTATNGQLTPSAPLHCPTSKIFLVLPVHLASEGGGPSQAKG